MTRPAHESTRFPRQDLCSLIKNRWTVTFCGPSLCICNSSTSVILLCWLIPKPIHQESASTRNAVYRVYLSSGHVLTEWYARSLSQQKGLPEPSGHTDHFDVSINPQVHIGLHSFFALQLLSKPYSSTLMCSVTIISWGLCNSYSSTGPELACLPVIRFSHP